MRSGTLTGHVSVSRPGVEPGPGPSEGPVRSATPSGHHQSRRLDSHQHRTGLQDRRLSQSSHVGKHEREESNPVRQFWRLPALPGAHSCKSPRRMRPGAIVVNHFSSSTFQYASLTNFDQLSIRTSWSAYSGFHVGRTGCLAQPHAGLLRRAVGLALVARHARQHAVRPSSTRHPAPAARRGRSSVPRCPAGTPQYWQV